MAKGMYHYIKKAWKKPDKKTLRERMVSWRASPAITEVDKPLRLDRARALGYKDKKGFTIIRIKVPRGGHKKSRPVRGRRSKRMTSRKTLKMNYKWIAEQRTARKYKKMEVLNSYEIGKDGIYYFYEVILVNPEAAEIKKDKTINWVCKPGNKGRVFRGLTSAGKKSRGLRSKHPTNKSRLSTRAGNRKGK